MPAKNLCHCVISTNKTFIKIDIYCVPLNINEAYIYIVYTEMLAAPILKISVNRLVLERNGKKKRKTKSIQSTKEHV